jgi:hypothetical protein
MPQPSHRRPPTGYVAREGVGAMPSKIWWVLGTIVLVVLVVVVVLYGGGGDGGGGGGGY